MAHVEPGVVLEQGADPGQYRAGPGPPGVAVGARLPGGDPLAGAVVQGGLAVQGSRHLHAQPGRLAHHPAEKADIEFARFGGPGANGDVYARGPEPREALAAHQGVGVGQGGDDLADPGAGQGVAAGAGAAVVRAGLQCHIGDGSGDRMAFGLRIAQGHDFRMGLAGLLGVAFAQDPPVGRNDHAAHAGIGLGQAHGAAGLRQGLLHEGVHRIHRPILRQTTRPGKATGCRAGRGSGHRLQLWSSSFYGD